MLAEAQELLAEARDRMGRFENGMGAMWSRCAAVEGLLGDRPSAGLLHLSTNTVKTHARAVYRKLGVNSRTVAVEAARGQRLL